MFLKEEYVLLYAIWLMLIYMSFSLKLYHIVEFCNILSHLNCYKYLIMGAIFIDAEMIFRKHRTNKHVLSSFQERPSLMD